MMHSRIAAGLATSFLLLLLGISRMSAQQTQWTSTDISLATPTGVLAGTLTIPAGSTAFPVGLLIAGSGPTDRNGNTAGSARGPASLRLLAEALAERGIATVRYDKRGIGASRAAAIREADLRFEMFADDAAAWVRQLRADARVTSITVIGHSEGSLLGMLAVQAASAEAFVSMAGVARRADVVIREQLSAAALSPALLAESDLILENLTQGRTVDKSPPALAALFRPSVQPYLISWFRYAGATELTRVTVPTLLVQGTHDIQVPTAEAELLAAAAPTARLTIIDGMDHLLKQSPNDRAVQLATSYVDPEIPLAPSLVDAVAQFILQIDAAHRAGAAPSP